MPINKLLRQTFKLLVGLRAKVYVFNVRRKARSCEEGLEVWGYTSLNDNTYLGKHVSFNGMKIYGLGKVTIGNYFHSGNDCIMITSNHNYMGDAIPYDSTEIIKEIIIEDCVWIGSKVIILGGVIIGEGAIIQAGSVVVNNIPKYGIAGGNPAKVFKYRNNEHYEKLKSERKFH
ncbi:MAG: acyltransferase [Mucilaginibacter sp.]